MAKNFGCRVRSTSSSQCGRFMCVPGGARDNGTNSRQFNYYTDLLYSPTCCCKPTMWANVCPRKASWPRTRGLVNCFEKNRVRLIVNVHHLFRRRTSCRASVTRSACRAAAAAARQPTRRLLQMRPPLRPRWSYQRATQSQSTCRRRRRSRTVTLLG